MAPNSFMTAKGVVNFMLDNYDYPDACFLAERVHAEINSDESLKLLASCFYRCGDFYKSYHLLRSSDYYKDPSLKFLLAQCCYQMKKYTEAESLLTCNSVFKKDTVFIEDIINEFGSSAAFALFLIGDINRISCRRDRAKDYYKKCLNLNPFMWSAYQNLCDLEDKSLDADTLFTKPHNLNYCLDVSSLATATEQPKQNQELDPFIIPRDMSTPWLSNRCEMMVTAKKVVPPNQACPAVLNAPSKSTNFLCSKTVLNPAPYSTNTMNSSMNSSTNTTNPAGSNESTQLMGFGTPISMEPVEGSEMCGPHFSCLSVKEESSIDTGIVSESQMEDSNMTSSGNRRITRRQTKLMAAQSTPDGLVPIFNETSPTASAAFITPEGQNMADNFSLRAPLKKGVPVAGMLTKNSPNAVMLQTINNSKETEVSSVLNMPSSASPSVPLAPTNNNSSNQQRFSSATAASLVASSVNNPNQPQSSNQNQSGHLVTSQQTNANLSSSQNISNLSTTPLQQPPNCNNAGGMGLRRSSRLYNGSNQLKENSKSLSKGAIARRQKQLERAPNKSNSITNVLNADEEKLVTAQSQLVASTKQKQQSQFSNKDSAISLMSTMDRNADASTQTFCLVEQSKPSQSSDANSRGVNVTLQSCSSDLASLLQVYKTFGKSYHLLCNFHCEQSISMLQSLPPEHFETGWVLECVGRAYFEKSDFHNAAKVFRQMWDVEYHRLSGLDLYSTVLWQLKLSEDLSYLAHQMTLITKTRPEVWCVVGNCFSLQKEHEHAIQFLSRAIQLDPNYTYAYTLLGFEYLEIEMTAKAENCFRNAIRINERHYKAWFGLGTLYSHQEKYVDAEVHYSKALAIRRSPSLLCHLAVVLHKLSKSQQALDRLGEALMIDPRNALCKYHKAMILNSLNRSQEGLKILEELKLQIPNESLLYFSIGKVYKKLGEPHLEMMNVAWAMDLDPKGSSSLIKQAIEKRFLPQDEDMRANVDRVLEDTTYSENLSDTDIIDNTIEVDFLNYTP